MDAIDTLSNIANTKLIYADNLRFCLHKAKKPHTINGDYARPNVDDDFVSLSELVEAKNLDKYDGVGVSIKASKICAIDVDHCFKTPFDFSTADERGKYVYEKFKDLAYIEFSFSGTGMRILFEQKDIPNYASRYYIKNSVTEIEYYQPTGNARYVTVTGRPLADNNIHSEVDFTDVIIEFLEKYMVRPKTVALSKPVQKINEDKTLKQLLGIVNRLLFNSYAFQNLWFDSRFEYNIGKEYEGQGESEHDFALISFIYQNVTTDKEMVRQVFESSDYYKSKDSGHKRKWAYNNYRYYDSIFKRLV